MKSENRSDLLPDNYNEIGENLESMADFDREFFKKFGERVRLFRTSKGLEAAYVSSACGLRESDIVSLENGVYIPRLNELVAIASVLEIGTADLVDLSVELPLQNRA